MRSRDVTFGNADTVCPLTMTEMCLWARLRCVSVRIWHAEPKLNSPGLEYVWVPQVTHRMVFKHP